MTRTTYKPFVALLVASALIGCGKDAVQVITGPVPATSRIKFFNFGRGAPGVNFYANDRKVTAVVSSTGVESTTGTGFGGVGSGGFYSAIDPGQYTLTGKIAATTDKDLVVASVTQNIQDGKAYSFYMSGVYNTTTKTVEAFVVEDPFSATIDFSTAYVRFVNASSNSSPMTLYAKETTSLLETAVGGLVPYMSAGAFTAIKPGVYDLSTRLSGSSTNVGTRGGTCDATTCGVSVSFLAGRVYTISARGDATVASTTTTSTRLFLDNTANR